MLSWTGASVAQVVHLYFLENVINSLIESAQCMYLKMREAVCLLSSVLCMHVISISKALIRAEIKLRYSDNSD